MDSPIRSENPIGIIIEGKIKPIDIDNDRYLFEFTYMLDHEKLDNWMKEHEYLMPMVASASGLSFAIARNKKKARWEIDFCIQNEAGDDISIPIKYHEVTFSVCRDEESNEEWVVQWIDTLMAAQTD